MPRLGIEGSASLRQGFSAALLADAAREQTAASGGSRTQATLREAWLGWKDGASSTRLGWQIVNWGRTDVLNPTDNVAARDYTRLVDRDADQKLGLPMLIVQQRLADTTTVQALWQPLFRASRVPLPAQPGARYVDDRPVTAPGSAGLRIDRSGESLSAPLSWFRGPAKLPNLALSPAAVAAGRLALDHPHTEVLGADAEAVLGAWVIRGESAWTRVRGSGRDALASRESAIDTVIGIERAFGAASAFVQGTWKHIPSWSIRARSPNRCGRWRAPTPASTTNCTAIAASSAPASRGTQATCAGLCPSMPPGHRPMVTGYCAHACAFALTTACCYLPAAIGFAGRGSASMVDCSQVQPCLSG